MLLKPLFDLCKPPLTAAQIDTYFGILCDLPPIAIQAAAVEIARAQQSVWWPMPGVIRSKALELMQAPPEDAAKAFSLAIEAVKRLRDEPSPEHKRVVNGKLVRALELVQAENAKIIAALPAAVAEAARSIGWNRLNHSANDVNCFPQFRDAYNAIILRDRSERGRPEVVKQVAAQLAADLGGKFAAVIGVEK